MSRRGKLLFLVLLIAQALHSVEEYVTHLFEVFAPARFISGLVSEDLAVGFAIVNAVIVVVGAWCYVGPIRAGGGAGWFVAAVWVAIELANGIAHLAIAALSGGYFSGSFTAVVLVGTAACLALTLITDRRRVPVARGVT